MSFSVKDNIRPISDFRKASAQMIKKLQEQHHPIILTQRGRSVAVILDVDTYERLEYEKSFRDSYFQGVKDAEQGKTTSHREMMKKLRQAIKKSGRK